MRSALVTTALAVLTLLLSLAALVVIQSQQASGSSRQQVTSEYFVTLAQIRSVVNSNEGNWSQSDELAQLIALADVQTSSLGKTPRVMGFKISGSLDSAAQQVNADWLALREFLVSAPSTTPAPAPTVVEQPATIEVVVNGDIEQLSKDFALIRTRVFEGIQSTQLRSLADTTASNWSALEALPDNDADIVNVIDQQKTNAQDLLRLSGADTDQSLFGYSTKNLILSYADGVSQLEVSTNVTEPPVTTAPPLAAPTNNLSVTRTIDQASQAIDRFYQQAQLLAQRLSRYMWFAVGGFFVSLLLSLLAAWRMLRAARDIAHISHNNNQTTDTAVSVSNNEAATLLDDIESVSDGDLRYPVRVPDFGANRAIAESVNRSGAVMHNLVTMTRGVAERLTELVAQHNTLGQQLATKDISRQSQTAELSDGVAMRSRLLSEQQSVLEHTADAAKDIGKKFESASGTVNSISANLASVSAQVEVGSERMQRLLQTAGSVTEATGKLRQLAEQTRLQALNVSLRMTETEGAYGSVVEPAIDTPDLDNIHQLTARLVQTANEADTVVAAMQNDIAETAQALTQGRSELNESANLTYAASIGGKELASQISTIESKIVNALDNIEQQKKELSWSAESIVSLDKTGNDYSHLTMTLTQDIAELESMAGKLEESVSGFKLKSPSRRGEVPLER